MLTGLLPPDHGVRANAGFPFEIGSRPSLPHALKKKGYATGASVSSWILRGETGIAALFDDYEDDIVGGGGVGENYRPGKVAADHGLRWIASHGAPPFLFFLHLYEPHAPYEPPEPFRSRYAHAYDGEVAASDAIVGRFLDQLRSSGVYDRAIIVLTSDHGEGLMDHGEDQHGILLYREAIQVPLIVKLPRSRRGGETIDTAAQLSDLPATLLALTGIERPEAMPGGDLLDSTLSPSRKIYSETFYPRYHLGWSELRSLIDGKYHYIEAPRPELYDVASDPGERKDLLAAERRVATAMRREIEAIPKKVQTIDNIDEEAAARLRSLGYLSSPAAHSGELPNPNEHVHHLAEIKRGFLLADQGRWEEAATALRSVADQNPAMIEVSLKLGEVLTEMGRYRDAIAVYENAMRKTERFSPDLALGLATTQLRAGQLDRAAEIASLAITAEPGRAHEALARVAMARRRWDEAELQARRAAASGQPRWMLIEAEVAIGRAQYDRALTALDRAAQRNRDLGGAPLFRLEFLRGDAYARLSRLPESEASYRREIESFPRNLQAWGNLAIIYSLTGRDAESRRLVEGMLKQNPNPAARAFAGRIAASLRE